MFLQQQKKSSSVVLITKNKFKTNSLTSESGNYPEHQRMSHYVCGLQMEGAFGCICCVMKFGSEVRIHHSHNLLKCSQCSTQIVSHVCELPSELSVSASQLYPDLFGNCLLCCSSRKVHCANACFLVLFQSPGLFLITFYEANIAQLSVGSCPQKKCFQHVRQKIV